MPHQPQLCFCTIAFRSEPVLELLEPLAQIGYDGVEVLGKSVADATDAELAMLRERAASVGISIPVVSPYFVLTRGQSEYDQTLKTAERFVHIARMIGATKVRTFTDVARGVGSDEATQQQWEQAVAGLRAITQMAHDIEFVLETHPHTLADCADSTLRLLRLIDRPNLRINFQPTERFCRDGLIESYEALAPHTSHMHLQQVGRGHDQGWIDQPGEVDFPRFIGHLRNRGYRGTLSVEYCWPGVTWSHARSAYRYLRDLLDGSTA